MARAASSGVWIMSGDSEVYDDREAYSVLAKSKRHLFTITANFDVYSTVLAEHLGNSSLQGVFVFCLK
jgi:hypothetical protein